MFVYIGFELKKTRKKKSKLLVSETKSIEANGKALVREFPVWISSHILHLDLKVIIKIQGSIVDI